MRVEKMMKLTTLICSSLLAVTLHAQSFEQSLVVAAKERTAHTVHYDGSYVSIKYPNGDVPATTGVCTDVVVRAYRVLGVDLQQLVHEDMKHHFSAYPSKKLWGLTRTDTNIDHRRVPNLQTFFTRHGVVLKKSHDAQDFHAGDLVTWMLPGNIPHIGIVIDTKDAKTGHPLIVHNIGAGPEATDILFAYKMTGHYRYIPKEH